MLSLMMFRSAEDACQAPLCRNPLKGGGPVIAIGSACVGVLFEFTAVGGGTEKSNFAAHDERFGDRCVEAMLLFLSVTDSDEVGGS